MKYLSRFSAALVLMLFAVHANAMDITELKLENSNKVVFNISFLNGSIADPADKKGLTMATASLMGQGGAGGLGYAEIQDKLHPWSAGYFFQCRQAGHHLHFPGAGLILLTSFIPLVRDVLLAPNFSERDFHAVPCNSSRTMSTRWYVHPPTRITASSRWNTSLFRDGNMGHLVQGTSASVKCHHPGRYQGSLPACFHPP